MTYSGAANLAVNQTIVRSINTSIVALLPIGAILFAGVVLLGAGPLQDLALALFIGVAAGTYSSIFIATPLLAGLKEREPAMQALSRRVAARKGGGKVATTSRREQPSAPAPVEEPLEDDQPEPATAGAAARGGARPTDRRPSAGGGRNQPKRKNKSRPGGKKRR